VVTDVWAVTGRPADGPTLGLNVPEPMVVDAPERELRLLFKNCFVNAVEHAGPDVTVRVGTLDGGFYVADDGPGIPPERRSDVTERGFTTDEDGTGVELAVVSGVADSNDWKFHITDSRLRRGDAGADAASGPTADGTASRDDGPTESATGDSERPGARFEFHDVIFVTEPGRTVTPSETFELTDSAEIGDVDVPGESTYDTTADRWTVSGEGVKVYRDQVAFTTYTRPSRATSGSREPSRASRNCTLSARADSWSATCWTRTRHTATSVASRAARWRCSGDRPRRAHPDPAVRSRGPAVRPVPPRPRGVAHHLLGGRGGSWLPVDQRRVALSNPVHVGLAVCSVTPGESYAVTFEDVTVSRLETE